MAKVIKDDGSTYYYYYKKKVGRKKKRGPKKKKKTRGRRWQETWDFKIIRFDFMKQVEYIGKYHDSKEVFAKLEELSEMNDKVIFPKRFINNGRVSKQLYDNISEYVVLKRCNNDNKGTTLLRNEYGKLIPNETTSEEWSVYDKIPRLEEETFWVYGHNPKTDRKEIVWIMENLLENEMADNYNLIRVYLYNNKVIFHYDINDIEFVICKNVQDAIRMYNILEEKYAKTKQVVFTGMLTRKSDRMNDLVEMISKKTGWDKKKIYRKSTRG